MSEPRPCDLCALDVGDKPFTLAAGGRTLQFCCEGCRGIYEMLNEIKEATEKPEQIENGSPERSKP